MSDVKRVLKSALIIVGLRGVFCRPQKFTDENGILRSKNHANPCQTPYLSHCRCRLFSEFIIHHKKRFVKFKIFRNKIIIFLFYRLKQTSELYYLSEKENKR